MERLHATGSYFIASNSRVLAIRTDDTLRTPGVELLTRLEDHAESRHLFAALEGDFPGATPDWRGHAGHLRVVVGERLGAALPEPDANVDHLVAFGQVVRAACEEATRVGCEGLLVLLAPVAVEAGPRVAEDLDALVRTPRLAQVRWCVLTTDEALVAELKARLPDAIATECLVAPGDLAADVAAAMSRAAANHTATPAVWPADGPPPKRSRHKRAKRAPVALPPDVEPLVREAEARRQVSSLVAKAAAALAAGEGAEGVRWQALARDSCLTAGLVADGVRMELLLAAYQTRLNPEVGGGLTAAARIYRGALARADGAGLHRESAQASLGLAQLGILTKAPVETVFEHFNRAGASAIRAGVPVLAIEAFRSAGQLALDAGSTKAAAASWTRALATTSKMDAAEVQASSAAECARLFAALVREQPGDAQFAALLSETADLLESAGTAAPGLLEALSGPTSPVAGEVGSPSHGPALSPVRGERSEP